MIQVLLWSKNIAWNSTNYIKPSIPFEPCMNTELAMVISTEVYMGIYNISTSASWPLYTVYGVRRRKYSISH